MRALILIAVAMLTGCSALPSNRGSAVAEAVWQGMNVVDYGQTVHIARSKRTDEQMAAWAANDFTVDRFCYEEVNPITRAFIGKHPSQRDVAISSAVWGLGHLFISRWLDRRTEAAFASESDSRGAWYVGRIAYHGISLGTKAWQINHNKNIGLKPFGRGCAK